MGSYYTVNGGVLEKMPDENDLTPKVGNGINFCVRSRSIVNLQWETMCL